MAEELNIIRPGEYSHDDLAAAWVETFVGDGAKVGIMFWYVEHEDGETVFEKRATTNLDRDIIDGIIFAENHDGFKGWPAALRKYLK